MTIDFSKKEANITYTRGDDIVLRFSWRNRATKLVQDTSAWTVRCTIKDKAGNVVYSVPNGNITYASGIWTILIPRSITELATLAGAVYDVEVTDTSNYRFTWFGGEFLQRKDITT